MPLTDQVRIDREAIYELLDEMRSTIPEEVKQARWIVKERQEMLAEAKREADRIVNEAREHAAREVSQQEIVRNAEREAESVIEDARMREREVRPVSYTHLDVYKRQAWRRSPRPTTGSAWPSWTCACAARAPCWGCGSRA